VLFLSGADANIISGGFNVVWGYWIFLVLTCLADCSALEYLDWFYCNSPPSAGQAQAVGIEGRLLKSGHEDQLLITHKRMSICFFASAGKYASAALSGVTLTMRFRLVPGRGISQTQHVLTTSLT